MNLGIIDRRVRYPAIQYQVPLLEKIVQYTYECMYGLTTCIIIIDKLREMHIPVTSVALTEHVLDLVHRKYFRGVQPVRQILVVVRGERKRPGAVHGLVVSHEGLFEVEQAEDEGRCGDDASIGSGH